MDIDKANEECNAVASRLDGLLREAPAELQRLRTQIGQAKLEVRRCQSLLHTAKMRRRRRVSWWMNWTNRSATRRSDSADLWRLSMASDTKSCEHCGRPSVGYALRECSYCACGMCPTCEDLHDDQAACPLTLLQQPSDTKTDELRIDIGTLMRERDEARTQRDAALAEVERIRNALNVDQTGLAKALDQVRKIIGGWSWLGDPEQWGSYEYEEHTIETLRKEAGWLIEQAHEVCTSALAASGDIAIRVLKKGDTLPIEVEPEVARLRARVSELEAALKDAEPYVSAYGDEAGLAPSHAGGCSPGATDCDGDCADFGWWRKARARVRKALGMAVIG